VFLFIIPTYIYFRIINENQVFNAQAYFASVGVEIKVVEYRRSEKAYSQSDPAMDVMYIQNGSLKLSVVNPFGKEAVVAVLGPGDFFGEGCMAGHLVRRETASALTPATVLTIPKNEMIRTLRAIGVGSGNARGRKST